MCVYNTHTHTHTHTHALMLPTTPAFLRFGGRCAVRGAQRSIGEGSLTVNADSI